jgi:hypothetical protein
MAADLNVKGFNMTSIFPMRTMGLIVGLIAACTLTGCHGKTDANTELDQAVRVMQKTETIPPSTTSAGPVSQPSTTPPAQEMNQAVAAYKAGQIEDAVTRLQRLRATPTLTPQQRIALNDAVAAVMTEVSSLAAKGDPRAVKALQQYDKMQMQTRH